MKPSLRSVAYRQVSSVKRARCTPHVWGASFILKSVGDKTEPCGTPDRITLGVDISPSTETLNFLCERKEPKSLIELVENSNLDNLYSKPEYHVVSKAFSMSKNTANVDILLLKLRVTWSVSLMHCSVVLWRARKQNWLCFGRILPLTYIVAERTWTYSKHISRDRYSVYWRVGRIIREHSSIYCCVLYRVCRAVARQRID
jgi:hypothetical protein